MKTVLNIFFALIIFGCTSQRFVVKKTEPCRQYLKLKEKLQHVSESERPILEAKLQMLKASCAHSGNVWPEGSGFEPRGGKDW